VSDRNPRLHQTGIPYLDAVWNVVTGCGDERLSPGCQHCYARAMTRRNLWGYDFEPLFHESRLEAPLNHRDPLRIGITFMGDLWHEGVARYVVDAVFDVMERCPHTPSST
jgi:protein gp37